MHVEGARRIAKIAKQNNVTRFIHISSLNVNPAPVGHMVRKGSKFLRSKYYGELAVREEFPEAIIFRPSRMFGYHDFFFHYYMNRKNYLFRKMPLWNKGFGIYKQPVFNSDVAAGVINAIYENECVGKTIDAVGPRKYEQHELIKFLMRSIARGEKQLFEISELRTSIFFLLRTWFAEETFKFPIRPIEMLEHVSAFCGLTCGGLKLKNMLMLSLDSLGMPVRSGDTRPPNPRRFGCQIEFPRERVPYPGQTLHHGASYGASRTPGGATAAEIRVIEMRVFDLSIIVELMVWLCSLPFRSQPTNNCNDPW